MKKSQIRGLEALGNAIRSKRNAHASRLFTKHVDAIVRCAIASDALGVDVPKTLIDVFGEALHPPTPVKKGEKFYVDKDIPGPSELRKGTVEVQNEAVDHWNDDYYFHVGVTWYGMRRWYMKLPEQYEEDFSEYKSVVWRGMV